MLHLFDVYISQHAYRLPVAFALHEFVVFPLNKTSKTGGFRLSDLRGMFGKPSGLDTEF